MKPNPRQTVAPMSRREQAGFFMLDHGFIGTTTRNGKFQDDLEDLLTRVAGESAAVQSVMQDDLAALLRALGLGDHARPETPHTVMMSAIAEVGRLKTTLRGVLLRRGVSLSPCDICGYGGADYYQPAAHPCIGDILDASVPEQDAARLLAMEDGDGR